jgi:4-azaleucine resistance transporter AzlC
MKDLFTIPSATRWVEFWRGVRDSFPLVVGAVPFGIIFGALSANAGLSAAGAIAMSLCVFAGSAQFIAVGLVGAGTAWPMIVLTTFVVNFRHLLYTATLLPYLKRLPHHWQAILAFGLTDETFAVSVGRWRQPDAWAYGQWYQLGSMLFMYINWNICTVIGVVAGKVLGDVGGWGLDFAMVAAFIGMVLPYMKNKSSYATVFAAGVGALVFFNLPYHLGMMIAALLGIAAGVLAETRMTHSRRSHETETERL